ncbi:MAG: YbaB/EbfC family nucleoid-associated protein [bacterium]
MLKGDMNKLMRQAQELQQQMGKAQEELGEMQVTGEAGGSAVAITMTGQYDLIDVKIDPAAIDPEALEMLSELVAAALQDCLEKVRQASESKMGKFSRLSGGMF